MDKHNCEDFPKIDFISRILYNKYINFIQTKWAVRVYIYCHNIAENILERSRMFSAFLA